MRLSLWRSRGRNALLVIAIICVAAMFAAAQVRTPAQNPVDLDKALQEKASQDRAQSYYHYALSKWYDDEGDMTRALSEMQLAVRYNENESSVHVALADILARSNRIDEAKEEAQKASRLDPKDPEP